MYKDLCIFLLCVPYYENLIQNWSLILWFENITDISHVYLLFYRDKYDLQSNCKEIVIKILTFKYEKANFIYITFYVTF